MVERQTHISVHINLEIKQSFHFLDTLPLANEPAHAIEIYLHWKSCFTSFVDWSICRMLMVWYGIFLTKWVIWEQKHRKIKLYPIASRSIISGPLMGVLNGYTICLEKRFGWSIETLFKMKCKCEVGTFCSRLLSLRQRGLHRQSQWWHIFPIILWSSMKLPCAASTCHTASAPDQAPGNNG